MCNINMKRGNRTSSGSNGGSNSSSSGGGRASRRSNGSNNSTSNRNSNSTKPLQQEPVQQQQQRQDPQQRIERKLWARELSSPKSSSSAIDGQSMEGGGNTDSEESDGSSAMYKINTCSGINYKPCPESTVSANGCSCGNSGDVRRRRRENEQLKDGNISGCGGAGIPEEGDSAGKDPDKLGKSELLPGGEEEEGQTDEELIFLDMSHLKRQWQRLSYATRKSISCSSSLASTNCSRRRGHRHPGQRKSSLASADVGESPAPVDVKEERCDENLNEFYVVLVIVTIVCYLNGVNGDFVHDDIPAITMNKDVLALNPKTALFKNDFWGTAMSDASSHKSYRPLTTVSFRLNYLLFGLRPPLFHLTNILLHATVCVLFTRICFCVAGLQRQFAFVAGAIFATHPIHSEAVTGIVGRADVLACLFFLFSLLLYHGHSVAPSATSHKFWWSIACGGLSMLAKETGITVLVVNIAYDGYKMWPLLRHQLFNSISGIDVRWAKAKRSGTELRHFITRISLTLLFLGIFCAGRIAIGGSLPKFSQQDNPAAYHPCIFTRFLTFSYLAAFNWWLMICPTTLSHDWQMSSIPLITAWSDARNLLTVMIVLLLLGLLYRCLADFKNRQSHSSLLLGLLMLSVPFLPASNIVVTVGFVLAERVLYIPSLGSILLTVYGMQLMCRVARWPLVLGQQHHQHQTPPPPATAAVEDTDNVSGCCATPPSVAAASSVSSITNSSKSRSIRPVLRMLVLSLCLCNGLKTVHRNQDWMSRESLLSAGLKVLPHNAKMHYNFGNFLRDTSQIPLAMHHYHVALELWPTYSSAHNNLGTLVRDVRQAEFHFLEAIRYSEGHLNAHFNLGQLYKRTNRTEKACRMLEKCIQMDPKFIPGYIELFKLKRGKPAEELLREMAAIATKDQSILFMFGKWLMMHDYHVKAYNAFVGAFRVDSFERIGFLSYLNACQMLRHLGKARLLQFIIRYHWLQQEKYRRKKGYQPNIYLREWAIKTELKYRARIYDPLEHPEEYESMEKDEKSRQQQQTNGESSAVDYPVDMDRRQHQYPEQEQREHNELQDGEGTRSEAGEEEEEENARDENKSSLAHFSSNQMDQQIFRLKFPANHRTCNITKWLYPIVKEKRRLLGPIQSPYMLEQILQNTQIHEKSPKNQRCISSILRHLRMTRKWHHNNVVPYLMANLWDNL